MRALALVLACVAALAIAFTFTSPAAAGMRARDPGADLHARQGSIIIPPEWGGIWTSVDTTYDCNGVFQSTSPGRDTLCAGKEITFDEGSPYSLVCEGTATATTADMICTYTSEIIPDCTVTFTIETHGTMSGDSYTLTTITTTNYAGTAEGCDLIPDSCTRRVAHGTRIAPEPVEYCETPTLPSTWGRVKSRYH